MTIVVGSLVLVLGTFLVAKGTKVNARGLAAVPLAAWWLSPLGLYLGVCRTTAGSWLIGVGFIVAVASFLLVIYKDDSSTAALGLLTVPMMLWAGMGIAVFIDRAVTRARSNRP